MQGRKRCMLRGAYISGLGGRGIAIAWISGRSASTHIKRNMYACVSDRSFGACQLMLVHAPPPYVILYMDV